MRHLLVFLLTTSTAMAQDCAGTTQTEMNICSNDAFVAADKSLNATYQEIVGRLGDAANVRAKLVASERAWLAFRDAQCAFAASGVDGGSVSPMIVTDCLTSLTLLRQTELASYLTCQDGDLSCPVPAK